MVKPKNKPIEHQVVESILRSIGWILRLPFRWLFKKSTPLINRQKIDESWRAIESLASSSNTHELAQAIIVADKLFDSILQAKGLTGQTMGERLKKARDLYRDNFVYQGAWDAHKLRNAIAHELNLSLDPSVVRQNLEKFKKAIFILI